VDSAARFRGKDRGRPRVVWLMAFPLVTGLDTPTAAFLLRQSVLSEASLLGEHEAVLHQLLVESGDVGRVVVLAMGRLRRRSEPTIIWGT